MEINESSIRFDCEASILRVAPSVMLTPSSAGDHTADAVASLTEELEQEHEASPKEGRRASGNGSCASVEIEAMLHDFDALLGIGCDSEEAAADRETEHSKKLHPALAPAKPHPRTSVAGFARFKRALGSCRWEVE